jgi:V-type H+-transporting ATPase 16kDa proteolipid subunit
MFSICNELRREFQQKLFIYLFGGPCIIPTETTPFFSFLGVVAALVFSCMGATYRTTTSGVGVASIGVMRPELVMKSIVPLVMAGVLGIYSLIIAVISAQVSIPRPSHTTSFFLQQASSGTNSGSSSGD